jgi:prepilin-type N-terminal cleavage/methylation domain-containing protein
MRAWFARDRRHMPQPRWREGFTLVELLVVILVVAILLAVAAPSFLGLLGKAHDSVAKQYLTVAWRSARAEAVDHDGYYNVVGTNPATRVGELTAFVNGDNPDLTLVAGDCRAVLGMPPSFIAVDNRVPSGAQSQGSSRDQLWAYSQSRSGTVWGIRSLSAHEVIAGPTFNKECSPVDTTTFPLQVVRVGGGRVTSAVTATGSENINCGNVCQDDFASGATVALTATPDDASDFVHWGGDCSGTSVVCVVTIDTLKNVVAIFDVRDTSGANGLGVLFDGSGSGRVTSSPAGIDCTTSCVHSFAPSTTVTLTADPDPGSAFSGWSGDCTGSGTCTLSLSNGHEVTANFDEAGGSSQVLLLVSVTSAFLGHVDGDPGAISCASDCRQDYAPGSEVTLVATPTPGAQFGGWSGDCHGAGECQVRMDRLRSVRANFALEGGNPAGAAYAFVTLHSVAPSPPASTGKGAIVFNQVGSTRKRTCLVAGGITALTCMFVANQGATLHFAPTPAAGSGFNAWEYPSGSDGSGGDQCSGNSGSCDLQLVAAENELGVDFRLTGCTAAEQVIKGVCTRGGVAGSSGSGSSDAASQSGPCHGGFSDDRPNHAAGAPANDDFCYAQVLSGASGTAPPSSTTFTGATVENGQSPIESGQDFDSIDNWANAFQPSRSVWFVWTAPATGKYDFTTQGSPAPWNNRGSNNYSTTASAPAMAIYVGHRWATTGSAPSDPERLQQVDGEWANGWDGSEGWTHLTITAVAGTQYAIALLSCSGFHGCYTPEQGAFKLSWSQVDTAGDTDADSVPDASDNCPLVYNSGQSDGYLPGAGIGDQCEVSVTVDNQSSQALSLQRYAISSGQYVDSGDGSCAAYRTCTFDLGAHVNPALPNSSYSFAVGPADHATSPVLLDCNDREWYDSWASGPYDNGFCVAGAAQGGGWYAVDGGSTGVVNLIAAGVPAAVTLHFRDHS